MRQSNLLVLALLLTATPSFAQEYRWEQNDQLGVRVLVHRKLFPVPIRLGDVSPHEKVRYLPKDAGDYLYGRHGSYEWYLNLLEFPKARPKADKPDKPQDPGTTTVGGAEATIDLDNPLHAEDFRQWVTEKDMGRNQDRKFVKKAETKKGKRGSPDYEWWEYTDTHKIVSAGREQELVWYSCAAVYTLPDRQVGVVATVPVRRGDRADPKHKRWLDTMCESLVLVEATAAVDDGGDPREKYANTPERKAELERAKSNIQSLTGWDFYTTPNYVALYSWDPEKPVKQRDGLKFATELTDKLEEMRDLYTELFPPHDKMLQMYSVLRVCDNHKEFMKYGGTGYGIVGWFNKQSRELVVFDDKARLYGNRDEVFATTMHEGWHQYAHTYFGGDMELHRWFDEGTGDYFGAFTKKGRNWVYNVDKGRYQSIRGQIARDNFIRTREIVTWNKDKFYGPRAPDHYAQGYSLIDFLRRGPDKLGNRFDERWTQILDIYTQTMLDTKDQKKAAEKAFDGVDWQAFEAAWIDWVKGPMK